MVSPQNPNVATGPEMGVARSDRGFVTDVTPAQPATAAFPYAGSAPLWGHHYYFWGSVIAGTLVTISIFVLSMALMFGCSVGVYNPTHQLSYGWGAAIWICITSCIAYYFGGMVSGSFVNSSQFNWLRGFSLWGLSIPLMALLGACIALGAGAAYGASTAHVTEQVTNQTGTAYLQNGSLFVNYGGAWTAFVAMIVGLFFSMIGSMSSGNARAVDVDRDTTATTVR